jgi:hypothetical protein
MAPPSGIRLPGLLKRCARGLSTRLADHAVLAGAAAPEIAREVRAQAGRAFALLESGLGDYAVKAR